MDVDMSAARKSIAECIITETVTLDDVLITDQLATRQSRIPDYHAENEALHALTQDVATGTAGLLQSLIETAVKLCHAGTAGISILETSERDEVFRWCNMAGVLADQTGGTTPASFSPCGATLGLGVAQLFDRPYRYFTYFQQSPALFMEGLVIPLPALDGSTGTIWIVSHDDHQFDREDLRIMTRLASFASAVIKLIATSEENERLLAESRDSLTARDSLIATIAHDLKTPLTSLKGRSQLLARRAKRLAAPGTEQIQEGLEELPLLVDRMSRQIDELLDVSRLRAGQALELRLAPVDATALVTQCISEAQLATRNHRISLSKRSRATGVIGNWDYDRLQRVIGNLLSNAIKYSPVTTEIVVDVTREDRGDQSWALITVHDEGLGIPKAELPKLFRPYWRSDQVKGTVNGNGIGLTSVLQIVELHGGSIRVESERGHGSTFIIQLPIIPANEAACSEGCACS